MCYERYTYIFLEEEQDSGGVGAASFFLPDLAELKRSFVSVNSALMSRIVEPNEGGGRERMRV